MIPWKLIIWTALLVCGKFSFAQSPSSGAAATPLGTYVGQVAQDIATVYHRQACRKKVCGGRSFLGSFLKSRTASKESIRALWRKALKEPREEPVFAFLQDADEALGQRFQDGMQNIVRIYGRWLLAEAIYADLQLSVKDVAANDLLAEVADRAFRAHQIERAEELLERRPVKKIESIADVRMELIRARLQFHHGQNEESYARLMNVLTSGVLADPKVLSSTVLQNQKDWLWNQLLKVSRKMELPSTEKAIQLAGPQVIFMSSAEHEFAFFDQLQPETSPAGKKQRQELAQIFFLKD